MQPITVWHPARHSLYILICLLITFCSWAESQPKQEVMVPMRDGVKLATNIYLPAGEGPWPVVLTRTRITRTALWSTANTFEKGHRIAIHVSSRNYPRFDINKNRGEALDDLNAKPRTAKNTIYFDAKRPSAIILPVVTEAL